MDSPQMQSFFGSADWLDPCTMAQIRDSLYVPNQKALDIVTLPK